ncbi:heptosyltransferase family protein, partial [hydrothermal vent metagenome]
DSLGAGVSSGGKVRLNLAPDSESVESAQSYFETKGVAPGDLLIGIQAGASREDRRWSPASFAVVADRLAQEKGAKIVLFGAASEKKLGDEVEAAMSEKAINLIGATDLEQLTLWIKRVNLLITNDTGTMHISAALGTPIVALFFVHARAEETGPYCEGAVVLQADIDCSPCSHQTVCGHLSCLKYITANDVIAACNMALDRAEKTPDDDSLFRRVKVYVSGFGRDGFIDFRPLKREQLDKPEMFAYLYRPLFNETFLKWDAPETIATKGIGGWAIDDLKERFKKPDGKKIEAWIGRGVEGAGRLIELAQSGERLALKIIEAGDGQNSSELMEIGGQLTAIDYSISVLSGVYDVAKPLAHVYKRRAENFEGDDPIDLARQALKAHCWLKMSASLFIDICGRALEELKNDNKKPDSYEITEGKER